MPVLETVRIILPTSMVLQTVVAVALTFLIAWRLLPAERRLVKWTKALLTRRFRQPALVKS